MYDKEFFLVENEIDRYAIADYTPELAYNDDGSLDIYIQHSAPKNHKSNRLPAPDDDFFNLVLRMYHPSAKVLNGTYEVPGVKRVR
jgi:hypothetical protein